MLDSSSCCLGFTYDLFSSSDDILNFSRLLSGTSLSSFFDTFNRCSSVCRCRLASDSANAISYSAKARKRDEEGAALLAPEVDPDG